MPPAEELIVALLDDPTRIETRLDGAPPGSRIASYALTGDKTFVSKDGRTTFAIVYAVPGLPPRGRTAPRSAGEHAAARQSPPKG
jgi:hypothetical protein